MFVEKFLNNGIEYLRLVKSARVLDKNGVKTSRKSVVYNIGPLKKFDDGEENYIQRLKESFKNGTPIIEALKPYVENTPKIEKYKLTFQDGDPCCIGEPKIYSHMLIERIMEELGLISFFARYKEMSKIEFDLVGFFRLLVYGRILNPCSKIATVKQNNDYLNPIIKECYEYNIYDTLSFVNKYKNSIINKLNKTLTQKFNRKTDLIYYDVTNFYFEIDEPDEDIVIENEIIEKGLRKKGISKEGRTNPIVQMGLFMDNSGLPISIETFPGNTLDHLTLIDSLSSSVNNLNLPRFILVGDRGMCNGTNLHYLTERNHGYVISKSILKSSKSEQEWIYDPSDFIEQSKDFKYKSKIIKRQVKDSQTGKLEPLVEKVVIYWSRKFYEKQRAENRSFLEFIEKLKTTPQNFRVSSKQAKSVSKFLKNDVVLNTKTKEEIKSKDLSLLIDDEKIKRYENEMGFYQIVSSELDKSELEIIDIYHGLTRIEEQFKVMKGDLDSRPMFVRTPENISAHLLICMISLLIVRIIQNKIVDRQDNQEKSDTKYWQVGLIGSRIQAALNKWTVDNLNGEYYRFNNLRDEDLNTILEAFDIKIPTKLFKKSELLAIKTNIKISM